MELRRRLRYQNRQVAAQGQNTGENLSRQPRLTGYQEDQNG
jgi:hypothetical protein